MTRLRETLAGIETHLLESMGNRKNDDSPRLAPQPQPRDMGRRPLAEFGVLAIEQVVPDPDQPRTTFSEEALSRLAESICDKGQLAPIRVRWSADLEKWAMFSAVASLESAT